MRRLHPSAGPAGVKLKAAAVDRRDHWHKVYSGRRPTDLSWYQPIPELSLRLIRRIAPDRTAAIIDVGGGASTLVDGLLAGGYGNLTVLDVSGAALVEAASRLGAAAARVTWLEADALATALPASTYHVWHDRAAFHFMTEAGDRRRYVEQMRSSLRPGGHVVVATFAPDGPTTCSRLPVARYAPDELHAELGAGLELIESVREEHRTPAGMVQPFIYCLFRVESGQGQR